MFGQSEEKSPVHAASVAGTPGGRYSKIGMINNSGYGQKYKMKKNVKSYSGNKSLIINNSSSSNNNSQSARGGASLIGRGINASFAAKKWHFNFIEIFILN